MKIIDAYRNLKSRIAGVAHEVRAIPELIRHFGWQGRALLNSVPRGDGRPVLVIPGFLCGDLATRSMRRFLRKIGYNSFGWNQGINWGPRAGVRTRLLHRINEIHQEFSQPVTLIGWSLGGVYARELPCIRPDLIREVITLGSPMQGKPESLMLWSVFRWLNRGSLPSMSSTILDYSRPILGDNLAIFTREDGIVPWNHCRPARGQGGESIEVKGTHTGLVHNPDVMTILAHHLHDNSQPRIH